MFIVACDYMNPAWGIHQYDAAFRSTSAVKETSNFLKFSDVYIKLSRVLWVITSHSAASWTWRDFVAKTSRKYP